MTSARDRVHAGPQAGRPRSRYSTIWGKRRITIPHHVFEDARLKLGDRLRATPTGPGRVVLERVEPTPDRLAINGTGELFP